MKNAFRIVAIIIYLFATQALAWVHGVAPTAVGQTVVNISASALSYLNLSHSLLGGSSTQAGWPGALTSDGYPTSGTTAAIGGNSMLLFPSYFGRYKIWWTGNGAFSLSSIPVIAYSGGGALAGAGGSSGAVATNPAIGFNGATQPTSGTPLEFAFGVLLTAVADGGSCTGGTAGLVCLTTSLAAAMATGNVVQTNNVTNLSAGPWTITVLDTTHIQLQGSTYSGSMAVVGGGAGPQSEAIRSVGGLTWSFPAQGTASANYSSMGGMVICRSQNVGFNGTNDCAAIGTHHVNPDYVTTFKAPNLNPRFIRFMDQTSVQYSFATSYAARPVTTQLAWGAANTGPSFFKGYWAGKLTNGGSDVYTTASNPTSSPASGPPVDGEVAIGYIDAAGVNMGVTPTLAVNRSGFGSSMPILNRGLSPFSLAMSGSVPPTATTVSLLFTGGGLSSPFTYNYLTTTSLNGPGGFLDTSLANIAFNIRADLNGNIRGNSGALVTARIKSANPDGNSVPTGTQMTFKYNPNINSSGVAALGSGMTISGSDNGGAGTVYTVGYVAAGYLANNQNFTFTFSSLAQGWVSTGTATALPGPQMGPPLEFYEDFCISASVGMYLNLPVLYSDDAVYNTVLHIANSGVKELLLAISNETWNTGGGGQYFPFDNLGIKLGLLTAFTGGSSVDGYTGLRTVQIATQARAAWAAAGRNQNQLFINSEFQLVNTASSVANRFNGGVLTPASNVTLAAFGGSPSSGTTTPNSLSTDLSTFPNRPIDWSTTIGSAPYFTGIQFNSSFGGGLSTAPIANYNCSLIASYNYVNGNSAEQQAALDWMFNGTTGDFYTLTTLTGGAVNSANLKGYSHGSGASGADYYGIPTVVAAYDAARTGTDPHTGLAWQLVGAIEYEGDQQAGPITASDATTIATSLTNFGDINGYTSGLGTFCSMAPHAGGPSSTAATDAANMRTMLTAFKNDNRYKLLYLQYFSDFKAAITSQGARIAIPTTFGFEGTLPDGGSWAKYPGSIYTTPYKSWDAIKQQNN